MITILHIAEIILYIILAVNTGYLLLFAIASKFSRPRIYPRTAPGTKFAVLFPAYKEDKVIIPAIYSFLQQDYPRELYDIIVISDQMQESTNEALRQLPVRLLIADYTDSSNAKAMRPAPPAPAPPAPGADGKVEDKLLLEDTKPAHKYAPLYGDEEFSSLHNYWQWNHEPDDSRWKLLDNRLILKTGII